MNWYNAVKFLHIVSVVMCIGGLFARQVVRQVAKQTDDIQLFAALSQAAGKIETRMVIPGNMALLVLGVALALMGGYPIFGFLQGASQNWLLVSTLMVIGMLALVPTVFIPGGKKFDPILQAALSEGKITPAVRAALDDPAVKRAHLYEEVGSILIIALMVLKPF